MKKTLLLILFSWVLISCNKTEEISMLRVTPTDPIEFSAEATETFVLTVNSTNCDWVATSSQPWCRVTKFNNKITISAFANDQTTAPTPATVTFEAPNTKPVVVHVTQLASSGGGSGKYQSALAVSPTDAIQFSAAATETFVLNVTTTETVWDAISDQPWCRVIPGGSKIVVTALPNTSTSSPEQATITVTAGNAKPVTITVGQMGAGASNPMLTVSPSSAIQFSAESTESFVLDVVTNQGAWDAVSDQLWCKVVPGGSKLFVYALPNGTNKQNPTATITVTSGNAAPITIQVNQDEPQYVYIPDLTFRNAILSEYDTNGDGKISLEEATLVTSISQYGANGISIYDVTGIEAFVNLKTLRLQGTQYFTHVDLSNNKKLTAIEFQSKKLSSLNINGLTDLTYLSLWESSENFIELDVSTNTSLMNFSVPNSVQTLWVSNGQVIDNFYFSNPDTDIRYR